MRMMSQVEYLWHHPHKIRTHFTRWSMRLQLSNFPTFHSYLCVYYLMIGWMKPPVWDLIDDSNRILLFDLAGMEQRRIHAYGASCSQRWFQVQSFSSILLRGKFNLIGWAKGDFVTFYHFLFLPSDTLSVAAQLWCSCWTTGYMQEKSRRNLKICSSCIWRSFDQQDTEQLQMMLQKNFSLTFLTKMQPNVVSVTCDISYL